MSLPIFDALAVHDKALEYAVEANLESKKKFDDKPNSIVRDAFWVLCHDNVTVHRAIKECCKTGWSPSAAILARTQMDMLISTIAIIKSENPDLSAFRYLYTGYRAFMRDKGAPDAQKKRARETCRERLKMLVPDARKKALRFLHNEKQYGYWYFEEFRCGPIDFLEQHTDKPESGFAYRVLSAAAHGGFLGIRYFRDDPDRIDINPRIPPARAAERVLAISARFLVEQTYCRAAFEGLPSQNRFSAIAAEIEKVAATAMRSQAPAGQPAGPPYHRKCG